MPPTSIKFRGRWYKCVKVKLNDCDPCYECSFNGMNCALFGIDCNGTEGVKFVNDKEKNKPSLERVQELENDLNKAYEELNKLKSIVDCQFNRQVESCSSIP